MSNNEPDYKENLFFEPSVLPRWNMDELKREIKHLKDLQKNQDKEVESLRDLLRECVIVLGYAEVISHSSENKEVIKKLVNKVGAAIGYNKIQESEE